MKIIIIGAGPGGYEAAIRAAQLGNEVVLIEKGHTGGTCLNVGCIPTKTLVKIAETVDSVKDAGKFGVMTGDYSLDEDVIFNRKAQVVDGLRKGVEFLFSGYKNLEYVRGFASFKDEKTVEVKTDEGVKEFTGDAIIIATGSKDQKNLPGSDLPKVLSSTDLLNLKEIPKSMIVIGTGVIGLEFASIYSRFGTDVTVMGNNLLKVADGEIQKRLNSVLKNENLKFATKQRAQKIEQDGDMLKVTTKMRDKDEFKEYTAEYVLVAMGRDCNTDGLNAEAAGVKLERGGVVVDENFETATKNIYAIGDVVYGNTQLAHLASAQGISLVEKLSGLEPKTDLEIVPSIVFSIPEIAMVGKTEEELKEEGVEYEKSKFLYASNSKSVSADETAGFIKILASKDGKEILGCHIVGAYSDYLIHFAAIAMNNGIGVQGLSDMIYAHPTVSELFMDAVQIFEGKSINTPGGGK